MDIPKEEILMKPKTLWIILAIATALRIAYIWGAPNWYDENFTLVLARLPFDSMIAATAGDVHPPLWYLIEWALYHVLPALPAWGIRIPAALLSLASVWTLARLMEAMRLPRPVQTVALVMMAVLPMQLWYAQEGRMYALLEFLTLAALLAALKREWLWLVITSIAMLYTQNYAMFYLPVIYLLGLNLNGLKTLWRYAVTGLIAVLAYVPWVTVILSQMGEISGRYWIMNIGAGAVIESIFRQFWASAMLNEMQVGAYAGTIAALALGLVGMAKWKSDNRLIILSMAFGPLLLSWAASWIWQPVLLFRPLIGTSPFLYVVAAFAIDTLKADDQLHGFSDYAYNQTFLAAVLTLPLLIGGVGGYYANIRAMKGADSMSGAREFVLERWQPGDVMYFTDDSPLVNFMPYVSADYPLYKLPACDERTGYGPVLGSLSDATREAMNIHVADLADVTYTRAWVFAPRTPLHPKCYEDQIAPLTVGAPVLVVDDNEWMTSGVWLLVNAQAAKGE